MGLIEQLIVSWIGEDGDRLNDFLNLLAEERGEEATFHAMRERLVEIAPECGEFWKELLLTAIVTANWDDIIIGITDRRRLGAGNSAWILLDRRNI